MGVIATMTLRKTRKLHHEVHASTFRHSLKTIMYASVCVCFVCPSCAWMFNLQFHVEYVYVVCSRCMFLCICFGYIFLEFKSSISIVVFHCQPFQIRNPVARNISLGFHNLQNTSLRNTSFLSNWYTQVGNNAID